MIRISISGDDWSVTATAHEERFDNPFDRRNQDVLVAHAIENALKLASYCLWNPFYVLATAVANLDCSENQPLQASTSVFIEAAKEYCRVAELVAELKESANG